jgi:hypothetical protein
VKDGWSVLLVAVVGYAVYITKRRKSSNS